MKKILSVMIVLLVCLTAGCGRTGQTDTDAPSGIPLNDVMQEILDNVSLPEMMALSADDLIDFFGLEPDWYTDASVRVNADGFGQEMIALFHAASDDDASEIAGCLQNALENAAAQSQNYRPEQYAMIQDSRVQTKGLYVWLFISDANTQMQTILNTYF